MTISTALRKILGALRKILGTLRKILGALRKILGALREILAEYFPKVGAYYPKSATYFTQNLPPCVHYVVNPIFFIEFLRLTPSIFSLMPSYILMMSGRMDGFMLLIIISIDS